MNPVFRKDILGLLRLKRIVAIQVCFIAVLALLVIAGLWGLSRAHFVGAQKDGHVAVYQGLPYDIVDGVHLYRAVYVSPVLAAQLTQPERKRIFDHNLESKNSAMVTVKQLEQRLGIQP